MEDNSTPRRSVRIEAKKLYGSTPTSSPKTPLYDNEETPTRKRRTRAASPQKRAEESRPETPVAKFEKSPRKGRSKSPAKSAPESPRKHVSKDSDAEAVKEFGGPVGCVIVVMFSHFLIYYVYISLFHNEGTPYFPLSTDELSKTFVWLKENATPDLYSVAIYLGFIFIQFVFAAILPGLTVNGLPVPSEGNKQLPYNCNGILSWYSTLVLVGVLHYTGYFPLTEVYDNFGKIATVAVIFADLLSFFSYFAAKYLNKQHRVTGNVIYDWFMGIWLNPRIGITGFDLKFWGETRVSWIMLFLFTLSAALKEYATEGQISPSMWFMLTAHGLYTNACMKGEECIPTTWDIFYEQWGWMLIYWNFAGVPMFYATSSFYIASHSEDIRSELPSWLVPTLFVVYLISYYIWDTAQSQRNRFRMKLRGTYVKRRTFPQLPWGTLENPKYMTTKAGSLLLVDGWWRYARKIHYTCDIIYALCWGLCCGFKSYLPYFYFAFFTGMIIHRYKRDDERCARKYGDDWVKYTQKVPYVFVPYVI